MEQEFHTFATTALKLLKVQDYFLSDYGGHTVCSSGRSLPSSCVTDQRFGNLSMYTHHVGFVSSPPHANTHPSRLCPRFHLLRSRIFCLFHCPGGGGRESCQFCSSLISNTNECILGSEVIWGWMSGKQYHLLQFVSANSYQALRLHFCISVMLGHEQSDLNKRLRSKMKKEGTEMWNLGWTHGTASNLNTESRRQNSFARRGRQVMDMTPFSSVPAFPSRRWVQRLCPF